MTTEGCTAANFTSVADVQFGLREGNGLAVVANTSGLFRFCILFLRISQRLKCLNGPYILFSQ